MIKKSLFFLKKHYNKKPAFLTFPAKKSILLKKNYSVQRRLYIQSNRRPHLTGAYCCSRCVKVHDTHDVATPDILGTARTIRDAYHHSSVTSSSATVAIFGRRSATIVPTCRQTPGINKSKILSKNAILTRTLGQTC